MFCQSTSAKPHIPHWCQNFWIPQERNFAGSPPPLSPWKLTLLRHLLSVPGPLRCASAARIQFWGVGKLDQARSRARNVSRMFHVSSMPSCDVVRSRGEVNHAGPFLYRCCDCLFCLVVGLYQGFRTPLGGPSGIRDCGSRRSVFVRLSDVRIASTGKILRW
jgi:hypothetical protein